MKLISTTPPSASLNWRAISPNQRKANEVMTEATEPVKFLYYCATHNKIIVAILPPSFFKLHDCDIYLGKL